MIDRYHATFANLKRQKRAAFVPFVMLGDPDLKSSEKIVRTLAKQADILELGIPFSDPLADGPIIQGAVTRALKAKTTPEKCLQIVQKIRTEFTQKPIGLLVYFNLIISMGVEKFMLLAYQSGVDSILIPEVPAEQANDQLSFMQGSVAALAMKHNLKLIYLMSTNTAPQRRKQIFSQAKGFIYLVSEPSITGTKKQLPEETLHLLTLVKKETPCPVCVGFGISKVSQVKTLAKAGADGIIIGSHIVQMRGNLQQIEKFCQECVKATFYK